MRYMLTEERWAGMAPLVNAAERHKGGQPPVVPDRLFFEALLYLGRTGIRLRDLPRGVRGLGRRVQPLPPVGGVRGDGPAVPPAGGRPGVRRRAAGVGGLDRRPGPPARGRRPAAAKRPGAAGSARRQALGRSRGGLTAKVILTAADGDTAAAADVRPGQARDAPHLGRLVGRTAARVGPAGRVVEDRGFDGGPQRRACLARGAEPVVPAQSSRAAPGPLDATAHRERNRVERLFAKLKEFRRVATRYDELRASFLGWVHLALGFLRLRATTNVNRA